METIWHWPPQDLEVTRFLWCLTTDKRSPLHCSDVCIIIYLISLKNRKVFIMLLLEGAVKTLNEWLVTKAGLWSLVPEYSKTLDRRRSQSIIISIGYLYNEPTHRAFYILGIFMKSIIIEPWESFLRRVAECVSYHEGADFDRDALCFSCNLCISCSVFFFTFLKLSLFILQKIYMLTVECETKLFVNPLITVLLLK